MKKEYQQIASYPLRIDPEMRSRLEAIAKSKGRSLNTEIAMRLEQSLREEDGKAPPNRSTRTYDLALAIEPAQIKHDPKEGVWRDSFRKLIKEELDSLLKEKGLLGKTDG